MTTFMPRLVAALALAVALGLPSAACSQTPPAPQGVTQQQADQMLKELKAIREALERVSPPAGQPAADPKASLNDLRGPFMGKPDAPLTLVEFTDLQCTYCSRFTSTTFGQIKAAYIDTGMVRFVSRDFPLEFHPQALPAARAARCAAEQGKYFEMRSALVRGASKLSPEFIATTAQELKLDMGAFTPCAASTRFDADIRRDLEIGMRLGIEGTPSFVLGRSTPNGVDGVLVVGAQPFQVFDAKIKEQLSAR
jgi:protein-disulfide isomerase